MKRTKGMKLWAVLLWLAVWQLVSMAVGKEILIVGPLRVLQRLAELIITAAFWRAVGYSFLRICGGFLLAALLAVVLAVLSSRKTRVEQLLAPLMLTIRSVPVASFIILALIWFSSSNLSILISFLMVLPVLYSNLLTGISAVDPALNEMATVHRIPLLRKLRYIVFPQLMPYVIAGCRSALGLCWKAGIAAEVIGMPRGSIGERLQQAKVYLDTPDLFAWTLVIVAASAAFEHLVLWALGRLRDRLEVMG